MSNSCKTILSLCDYSGNWSRPYAEAGYNVIRVDLKHGQDVRLLEAIATPVYGLLAAPPCTAFAVSGARWWPGKDESGETLEMISIADACFRAALVYRRTLRFWAIENPTGRMSRWFGEPSFSFDPCDFGDPYTKRTHLWGDFTPPLPLFHSQVAVEPSEGSMMWKKYGGKSERTKTARSTTPMGFAMAFFEANR